MVNSIGRIKKKVMIISIIDYTMKHVLVIRTIPEENK